MSGPSVPALAADQDRKAGDQSAERGAPEPAQQSLGRTSSTAVRPELALPQASSDSFGLTGDWNGRRTRLLEDGINLVANYTAEVAYNARGGKRSVVRSANQLLVGATVDLGKVAGLDGGTAQITLTQRHGRSLGEAAGFPQIMFVQEVYGRGNTGRLTEF